MQRITSQPIAEVIAAGIALVPAPIMDRLNVHWLTEDANFVGLHRFTVSKGFQLKDCAQCVYPRHQLVIPRARRQTTIVLPWWLSRWLSPEIVVHELGHELDRILGETHHAAPVTRYAEIDRSEAFAEAFTVWCTPRPPYHARIRATERLKLDRPTVSLFERFALMQQGPLVA